MCVTVEEVEVTAACSPLASMQVRAASTVTGEQLRERLGFTPTTVCGRWRGFRSRLEDKFVGRESDDGGDDASRAGLNCRESNAGDE